MKKLLLLMPVLFAAVVLSASEDLVRQANSEYNKALLRLDSRRALSFLTKSYRETAADGKKMNYKSAANLVRLFELSKKVVTPDAKLVDIAEFISIAQKKVALSKEEREYFISIENTPEGNQIKAQYKPFVAMIPAMIKAEQQKRQAAWKSYKEISCTIDPKTKRAKLIYQINSVKQPGKIEKITTSWRKVNGRWLIFRSTGSYMQ